MKIYYSEWLRCQPNEQGIGISFLLAFQPLVRLALSKKRRFSMILVPFFLQVLFIFRLTACGKTHQESEPWGMKPGCYSPIQNLEGMGWSVKCKSCKTPRQRLPINTENQSDVAWEATNNRQRGWWGDRNVKAEDSNSSHPTLIKQELYTGWQLPRRWSMHGYAKRFYPWPMRSRFIFEDWLVGFFCRCSFWGFFPLGWVGSGTVLFLIFICF